MPNNNKNLFMGGAIILIIIVAFIIYQQTKQGAEPVNDNATMTVDRTNDNQSPPTNDNAPATGNGSSGTLPDDFPQQPDTYQIALDNYNKGSRLLQFENCEARPIVPMFVFAGGTEIMIDGKSPDPQTVYLFGRAIELQGYDFEFITVPKVSQTQTYEIDCSINGTRSYNVAKIVVQP